MNKLQVGQKVFLKTTSNWNRHKNTILEWEILKVGRKYFEVWDGEYKHSAIKFCLDDYKQVTNYSPDYIFYFDKQDILDEMEAFTLLENIRKTIDRWGRTKLTLDQIRRIYAITVEGKENALP